MTSFSKRRHLNYAKINKRGVLNKGRGGWIKFLKINKRPPCIRHPRVRTGQVASLEESP